MHAVKKMSDDELPDVISDISAYGFTPPSKRVKQTPKAKAPAAAEEVVEKGPAAEEVVEKCPAEKEVVAKKPAAKKVVANEPVAEDAASPSSDRAHVQPTCPVPQGAPSGTRGGSWDYIGNGDIVVSLGSHRKKIKSSELGSQQEREQRAIDWVRKYREVILTGEKFSTKDSFLTSN